MNLNQVTVPSTNLSESIPFYEKLGLKLIVHSTPQYARFVCPDGNSTFSLHETDNLPEAEGIWVYFEVENLDEHVDKLKSEGIKFELDPTDQKWLWREAHLRDPDGNKIILFYAGEYRINPPWKIN